jgi:hypothetical protein
VVGCLFACFLKIFAEIWLTIKMKGRDSVLFNRTLFWDIDFDILDMEKHASFITERVLNRGSFDDFKAIVGYYGKDRLKEITLNVRYLDKKTLSFCALFFHRADRKFQMLQTKTVEPFTLELLKRLSGR